jgi:hypothetical protein
VGTFSGVLCVDEVYQDRLALLVAVDPAGPGGDRLIGYLLVHGSVTAKDTGQFFERLSRMGIEPDQIVTDGSALYPSSVAKVGPNAAHQMCLFHETRLVVRAVMKVIRQTHAAIPDVPKNPRIPAAFGHGTSPPGRASTTARYESHWPSSERVPAGLVRHLARRRTLQLWVSSPPRPALQPPDRRCARRSAESSGHRQHAWAKVRGAPTRGELPARSATTKPIRVFTPTRGMTLPPDGRQMTGNGRSTSAVGVQKAQNAPSKPGHRPVLARARPPNAPCSRVTPTRL